MGPRARDNGSGRRVPAFMAPKVATELRTWPDCGIAGSATDMIELLNEGVVDNVIAFFEGRPRNVRT